MRTITIPVVLNDQDFEVRDDQVLLDNNRGGTEARLQADATDDMDDAATIARLDNRPELARLATALRFTSEQISPAFRKAEEEVMRSKRAYMVLAQLAAWLGAAAVFFAILQLSELGDGYFPAVLLPLIEFSLAGAAVGIAAIAFSGRRQERWFVVRHRAEQLRLLKYRFLATPELWSVDASVASDCRDAVPALVEAVMSLTYTDVQHWVAAGSVPRVLSGPGMSDVECREFVAYYRDRRLLEQIVYFRGASQRDQSRNDRSRIWPSVLFFGSVAFVLVHFCIELTGWRSSGKPDVSVAKTALLLAASLPVWGAGIRVVRGIFEYGRNASRYESTHHVLLELSERLRQSRDPAGAFREIGFCEQAMEADLREWTRLMIEAEAFG